MKKILTILTLLIAVGASLFAGDLASFINLGFSEDSRYFMFAQYGIDGESSFPYAELYTVDVHSNQYTPGGVVKETFTTTPQIGQDGTGAMLTLLLDTKDDAEKLDISPLLTGRLVYLLVNGAEPKSQIAFRDFRLGSHYQVTLNQEQFGSDDAISSAFHINLSVTDSDGKIDAYTIGLPNYKRDGVRQYKIRRVFFAPDETSLVFVIEREEADEAGAVNIRYMVETVHFN